MFTIKSENLKLKLEVVPVDCLLQHEKTLPQVSNRLILEFTNWAALQHPIIVDENYIVLYGNHRVQAFKVLGFKYIPVCKIDYFHESMQLKCWFRLLVHLESMRLLKQIVENMNGDFKVMTDKKNMKEALGKNALIFGVQQNDFYATLRFKRETVYDAITAYAILEKIQDELKSRGVKLEYIPCQSAQQSDFSREFEEGACLIWTPQVTKEGVVHAAKKEKVFAPKTTRHVIPARPLNVDVPLHWFRENVSQEEINQRFDDFLKKKHLKRFGPGQVIDGRYYEEELFVFYD